MVTAVPADPPERLRQELGGVRALLLDYDGVLVLAGRPIPGAVEALARLDGAGLPYRVVTNTSLVSRETLARRSMERGLPLAPERIVTALSAAAAWTRTHLAGAPLFLLASPDAAREFAGQHLVSPEEVQRGARAAAVVVGDAPEALSWGNLNLAFRLLHGGARLVAMHRNRWWITPEGPTIDSGAFVAALEYAARREATVIGKPSPWLFRQAVAELAADLRRGAAVGREPGAKGGSVAGDAAFPAATGAKGSSATEVGRLRRRDVAMVGDDLETDVAGAHRVGLRAVFVLSGKQGPAELEAARRRGGRAVPDAVAPSLLQVALALVPD
jgi:HAD superfamily hydrolase (TIGR01450 family)